MTCIKFVFVLMSKLPNTGGYFKKCLGCF